MTFELSTDIAIYGIQGSGKTTQAEILTQKTGATFFYLGAEIRNRIKKNDAIGREMEEIISNGNYLDGRLIKIIFDDFIKEHSENSRLIYDTPARNPEQKPIFDQFLRDHHRRIIVILLKLDPETARKRLTGQHSRPDLSPEAVARRMELFYTDTVPVLEAYKKEGIPIIEIDASPDIETIAENIESALTPYLKK